MSTEQNLYFSFWNKYRPAILQLMKAAEAEPQQYKLFAHEFKILGTKEKAGYTFALQVFKGRAVNNINGSAVARDLLLVLQKSKTAMDLMLESTYELKMDKHFVLHIKKTELPQQAE